MSKPRFRVKCGRRPCLTVVPFSPPEPEIDENLISVIEQMTAKIESGGLVSLAVAGVSRDGAVSTAYVLGNERFALMGGIQHLMARILAG